MRSLLSFVSRIAWMSSPAAAEPDAAIVARLAARDASAMSALYDRYGRAVYSLALRIVRNPPDAEDVAQDVFAQAWQQATRYDASRGAVGAWLLNMARSRAIDRLRRRTVTGDASDVADDGHIVCDADLPDDLAALGARAARVRKALDALPFLQRVAIELAYYEGLSQSEIAERLEQPLGTVKTRMRSGLLKLRDALAGLV